MLNDKVQKVIFLFFYKKYPHYKCCGSGMIYSGSICEISEFRIQFRIRIQPIGII